LFFGQWAMWVRVSAARKFIIMRYNLVR